MQTSSTCPLSYHCLIRKSSSFSKFSSIMSNQLVTWIVSLFCYYYANLIPYHTTNVTMMMMMTKMTTCLCLCLSGNYLENISFHFHSFSKWTYETHEFCFFFLLWLLVVNLLIEAVNLLFSFFLFFLNY